MVSSGRLKSSRVCTPVKRGLSARPNRHTPVFEKMTKSMTLARAAVSFRGPIMMSIWLATSAGTLVSWLTTKGCICTPSSRANSLPRVQDGPDHGSPAPLGFCASQGGVLTTPTRSAPALRIAPTPAPTPGAGGGGGGRGGGGRRGLGQGRNAAAEQSGRQRAQTHETHGPARAAGNGGTGR